MTDEMIGRPDVKADAQRVYQVLKQGGTAIIPADVGYAICTTSPTALQRIFLTKQRGPHKRHAMLGSHAIHTALHLVSRQHRSIIDHLVLDLGLPLGIIARFNPEHPMVRGIDAVTMEAASVGGTLSILTGAGRLQDELTALSLADNIPILGSSANLSGTGTKYRVEDIDKEVLDIADVVIDYGLLKWWVHGRSSTMLDFSAGDGKKIEVVRMGAGYDVIRDVLGRRWAVELPEDPGVEGNRMGHLRTLEPLESLRKLIET